MWRFLYRLRQRFVRCTSNLLDIESHEIQLYPAASYHMIIELCDTASDCVVISTDPRAFRFVASQIARFVIIILPSPPLQGILAFNTLPAVGDDTELSFAIIGDLGNCN